MQTTKYKKDLKKFGTILIKGKESFISEQKMEEADLPQVDPTLKSVLETFDGELV